VPRVSGAWQHADMPVASIASRPVALVDFTGRMAVKLEQLLDEMIQTLRVVRPLVSTLARALDDGLIDDVLTGIQQLQPPGNEVGQVGSPGGKAVRRRLSPRPVDELQLELDA
jgi:hypothetical protein